MKERDEYDKVVHEDYISSNQKEPFEVEYDEYNEDEWTDIECGDDGNLRMPGGSEVRLNVTTGKWRRRLEDDEILARLLVRAQAPESEKGHPACTVP